MRNKEKIDKHIKCLICNDSGNDNSALIHSLKLIRDDYSYLSSDNSTDSDE